MVIDQDYIEELPIDDIVLDQIANVKVDNLVTKNFEELTNILNDDLDTGGVPDILLLDLEIDQLREDIQHQRNREREQRNQEYLSISTC